MFNFWCETSTKLNMRAVSDIFNFRYVPLFDVIQVKTQQLNMTEVSDIFNFRLCSNFLCETSKKLNKRSFRCFQFQICSSFVCETSKELNMREVSDIFNFRYIQIDFLSRGN